MMTHFSSLSRIWVAGPGVQGQDKQLEIQPPLRGAATEGPFGPKCDFAGRPDGQRV